MRCVIGREGGGGGVVVGVFFFFFNDTATTEIYTLSLHDALPILEIDTLIFYETFYFTLVVVPQAYNSRTVYIIPTPVVFCTTSEPVCSLPSGPTYLSDLPPTFRSGKLTHWVRNKLVLIAGPLYYAIWSQKIFFYWSTDCLIHLYVHKPCSIKFSKAMRLLELTSINQFIFIYLSWVVPVANIKVSLKQ